MLTLLLCEARIWPVVWRRRLAYWLAGEKENLAFLVMLGLPVLALAGIIYFAYLDATRIAPARIQAVQREATHARCALRPGRHNRWSLPKPGPAARASRGTPDSRAAGPCFGRHHLFCLPGRNAHRAGAHSGRAAGSNARASARR